MNIVESDKSPLAREWENQAHLSSLLSEPGRVGMWHNSEYVRWLEDEVRHLRLKIKAATNELSGD